jgi:hypothetical protein
MVGGWLWLEVVGVAGVTEIRLTLSQVKLMLRLSLAIKLSEWLWFC